MPVSAQAGPISRHRRLLAAAIGVAFVLALAWFIYRPGIGGTFLLDDTPNLSGLESVRDSASALQYVLSGTGGPLGRPLALASFVPQASLWGHDPGSFIRVNILIHLANGLLLYLFMLQLLRQLPRPAANPAVTATAGMALWLFMPILATTSLLIVQRMTLLSATFVLAGLNGYLLSRRRAARHPTAALAAMTTVLCVATVLATLSKENGILLPALVLVIEATLLNKPTDLRRKSWLSWTTIVLVVPTVLIVLFLVAQVPYAESDQLRRGFSAVERLFSQSRILWEYLLHAFVPRPGNYGPFHDAYPVARTMLDPVTLAAVVSWLILVGGAIYWRRKFPVAAFAVLWFVAGHLLESTTLPLELYFEHRNYVPLIGPVFALCLAVSISRRPLQTYAAGAVAIYLALAGFVLHGITTLWGQPQLAARYWYQTNPASVRAATTFATSQLAGHSPLGAAATLREFASRRPGHAYIRIPELNLACRLYPDADHSSHVEGLEKRLPAVDFSYTAGSMLDELLTASMSGDCPGVTATDVTRLATALAANPRYRGNDNYMQFHYKLMARIARLSGDTAGTLAQLSRAMEHAPDDDLNLMVVSTLVDARRFDEARLFVEGAHERLSLNPLRRYNSRIRLEELRDYIDAAERELPGDHQPRVDGTQESERNGED